MYYRRLKIFLSLIAITLLAVVSRLAYLQIVRADHYEELAEQRLIQPPRFIPTVRGRIVDRYDHLLATDEPAWGIAVDYRILSRDPVYLGRLARDRQAGGGIDPSLARNQAVLELVAYYDRLLAELARLCHVSQKELNENIQGVLDQVREIKRRVSAAHGRSIVVAEEQSRHTIMNDVPWELKDELAARLHAEPGFELISDQKRQYPYGPYTAHLVGVVGPVYREDIADDPFRDDIRRKYLPGEQKGISGVEWMAEAQLRGRRGVKQVDREGNLLQDEPPVDGQDVRLTIDADLQKQVQNVLARHVAMSPYPCGGAAVVINIGNRTIRNNVSLGDGDVLAMTTWPTYDSNDYRELYPHLVRDPFRLPLLNRAVQSIYPPGSIVKPAVLAGGLKEGLVSSSHTLNCPGYLISSSYRAFRCWNRYGHGDLTPDESLKHSCNVYFYKLGGELLGHTRLVNWLGRFGLGQDLHTGLPEERAGVLPTAQWIARNRDEMPSVVPADARNMAIGQGELSVTPLQAATMAAAIARGCIFREPQLVIGAPRKPAIDLGLTAAQVRLIHQGMEDVVNASGGTGKTARMDTTTLAGKTGSATASRRIIRIGNSTQLFPPLRNAEGHSFKVAHSWFIAFAPADHPTVAIACVIEYGMKGGGAAAPLARDVAQLCINLDYIPAPMENKREVPGAAEPPVLSTRGTEGRP